MASATTLYGKAVANFKSAKALFSIANGDEDQLNIIGFHLQQSMELALKYLLEQYGIEYPKTHDIEQLIRIGKERGADLHLNEYLEDHAEMLSSWESKSRYIIGYSIESQKIERALKKIDDYLTTVAEAES